MCGIYGFVVSRPHDWHAKQLSALLKKLCMLSETRGKDASGLIVSTNKTIHVLKRPMRAKALIASKEFKLFSRHLTEAASCNSPLVVMGHTRMVTNGNAESHDNNQPVIKEDLICIHNGIVVNDNQLWEKHPELKRRYEVDTEIILALINRMLKNKKSLLSSIQGVYEEIIGANSVAILPANINALALATSNGSLFKAVAPDNSIIVFASEKYILGKALLHPSIQKKFHSISVNQIESGNGCIIDTSLEKMDVIQFSLSKKPKKLNRVASATKRSIFDMLPVVESHAAPIIIKPDYAAFERFYKIDYKLIYSFKRCTKCILPETFPFIEYDQNGVCNFCHNYVQWENQGAGTLNSILDPVRKTDGSSDCLVPVSGGRDSSYALHYIVNELKMKPIAYTYDWGMVTDLARRNISRMCGALGIEHILVSSDISQKRMNIKKNVLAWLKKPHLGSVTLFMAGDKPFFYYSYMLRRQMGLNISILGDNYLENTDFKVGFCNIAKSSKGKKHFQLSLANKFQLFAYFGMRFIENSAFINSSLLDSIKGFASYYILPTDYVSLYDYIPWQEAEIMLTLKDEYDWEMADDTTSTWRIGDGTASFYNYIYYTMAGFTENDTFRSNQIREGMITREEALKLVEKENEPRFESIKWYCDIIGVDFENTIKAINAVPKRYEY